MSSIYISGLSYVTTSGAGGSINVTASSPGGLTINDSEEIFVPGATSNRTSVTVTNSFIEDDSNDLLLGGEGNNTLVSDLSTDTLTSNADTDSSVTSTTLLDLINDFNSFGGNTIGITANNISLRDIIFPGFDSTGDGVDATLVQSQDSFLGGSSLFNF